MSMLPAELNEILWTCCSLTLHQVCPQAKRYKRLRSLALSGIGGDVCVMFDGRVMTMLQPFTSPPHQAAGVPAGDDGRAAAEPGCIRQGRQPGGAVPAGIDCTGGGVPAPALGAGRRRARHGGVHRAAADGEARLHVGCGRDKARILLADDPRCWDDQLSLASSPASALQLPGGSHGGELPKHALHKPVSSRCWPTCKHCRCHGDRGAMAAGSGGAPVHAVTTAGGAAPAVQPCS